MKAWTSHQRQSLLSAESRPRFEKARKNDIFKDQKELRNALLDFIADFANWDNATKKEFLDTSRLLTQAAHEALGGDEGTKPLVLDSFAGGGAIPLEAARLSVDAFASDTSPLAVLINKVILELVPAHNLDLIGEVKNQLEWISDQAQESLSDLYPIDANGSVPTTYIWARTVKCEGPGCGTVIPLIRSPQIVRKGSRNLYLKMLPNSKRKKVDFELVTDKSKVDMTGTVKRGSATCPVCGYTTQVESVRRQLIEKQGGAADAQLLVVVTTKPKEQGRSYRLPLPRDQKAVDLAAKELSKLLNAPKKQGITKVPTEKISMNEIRRVNVPLYGMTHWGDLFTPRQMVTLSKYCDLIKEAGDRVRKQKGETLGNAVQVCLSLLLGKLADMNTSLCVWQNHAEIPAHIFGRWAIGMVFDFAETNPLSKSSGSPEASGKRLLDGLNVLVAAQPKAGHVERASATQHPLPDDSVDVFMVDPPYYDAIPYAHLMDFFYIWLRRSMGNVYPDLFTTELIEKEREIVVDRPHQLSNSIKDVAFYEREMQKAFADGRRVLKPNGIGVVVFASKTTASWEAILQATVQAGWVITGSWPIDTEMESRVAAQGQARLASSVHLVCRPRETQDGSVRSDEVGDWRDVLQELPRRIHEWMPRLAEEGIVGADAIFACLGPALEIYSRYSRVEKSNGEPVPLKEYLENVWAAVSKEALTMIFSGADATGFEEDARLTAMWLWTLKTDEADAANGGNADEAEGDDDEGSGKKSKSAGFTLEFDAARKIAQGLGARLEGLTSLVAVEGETARLLPVAERARALFGKDEGKIVSARKKREPQMDLFKAMQSGDDGESTFGEAKVQQVGNTVLDRIHQSMILFAAGRGEALKRFLADDGAGRDARFWTLAQALSALYPGHTEEKRWVDGVLARKKGLGF